MQTTSLKLPDDLKQRAVSAAQSQGVSPHAFMVTAIEHAATAAELRSDFIAEADVARAEMLESGKGYAAEDVRAYIQSRITGSKLAEPTAKSWRK